MADADRFPFRYAEPASYYRMRRRALRGLQIFALLLCARLHAVSVLLGVRLLHETRGGALPVSALLPALDFTYYRQLIDNPVFMGSLLNSAYVAVYDHLAVADYRSSAPPMRSAGSSFRSAGPC